MADRSEGRRSKVWEILAALLEKARLQWVSLALMTLTLGIAVWCIEQSKWISPQPPLLLVLALGVLSSAVLLKTRWHIAIVMASIALLGLGVIVWQLLGLVPTVEAASAIGSFLASLKSLGANLSQTNIAVALIFLFFIWIMAFLSTWFLLRKSNAWVAVALGALAILLNLRYITDDFYPYFLFYLFTAMLLVGQTNMPVLAGAKKQSRNSYSMHTVVLSIAALVVIIVIISAAAWTVPAFRLTGLQTFLDTKLGWSGKVVHSGINVFTTVSSKQTIITSAERNNLVLGGNDERGQDVQFMVTSTVRPPYWQAQRYDIYYPWGWGSSPVTKQALAGGVKVQDSAALGKWGTFTYKVVGKVRTDSVLTGGAFVSADVPVTVQSVSPGDVVAVSTQRLMDYGESYVATSRVNLATPAELAQAAANYPHDITDRYLPLPSELPRRVPQLARRITANALTPYAKVQAVQTYLYQLSYVEAGTVPPRGADGVDYFLFDARQGNCTNFASALAVMLRSVGVPSRVATGYLPRDWNESTGTVLLHARDYHAWVQVYFPGYGWVDFEATPASGAGNPALAGTGAAGGSPSVIEEDIPPVNSGTAVDPQADAGSSGQVLGGQWSKLFLLVAGLALFAFITLTVRRKWREHFHRVDYAAEVYHKMCLFGSVLRLAPNPSETPVEYSRRLSDAFPLQAQSINTISQTFQEKRFGRSNEMGWRDKQNLRDSWRMLSHAMWKRLFGLDRHRPFQEILVLGMGKPRL